MRKRTEAFVKVNILRVGRILELSSGKLRLSRIVVGQLLYILVIDSIVLRFHTGLMGLTRGGS